MKTATNASARTANGARQSLNSALQVAFRSGAVMGLLVVGFGLLYVCMWFLTLWLAMPLLGERFQQDASLRLTEVALTMLCFGMGASTQALFARVGGGIFTKAADVGADLVGKVEAGIPEDDPRNPATIADNVGDNVGDVAGMGADLFESYCNSILAAVALGATAGYFFRGAIAPMVIAGLGIAVSILGIYLVRTREEASQKALLGALRKGVWTSAALFALVSCLVIWLIFFSHPDLGHLGAIGIWLAIVAGLLAGVIVGYWSERYTSDRYRPTRQLAERALTGPATVVIEGMAVGMRSTAVTVIIVVAAFIVAYGTAGGFADPSRGLYGIGMAAVGMLSTLGITLATDAYGPIADNAGGNAEMTGQPPVVRERTDALDALGNTTAATGKGFAIGSAVLTALTLLAAYIEQVRAALGKMGIAELQGVVKGGQTVALAEASIGDLLSYYDVTPMNPKVLGGVFVGGMLAFAFCSMTMRAVGRAAGKIVEEVRRQFREIAGIMERKAKPDYATCVDIATRAAQREMIMPSLSAFIAPVVVGLILGPAGVIGLLVGGISTGFVLAVMLNNAGGAWDNAKKYIERGAHGGKGSDAHKAAVVGDTVGDPFKDTSGPSLNILIKLMSIVAVVFTGFTVKYSVWVSKYLFAGTR
jgi:K(+)-stimulated pyrophosphate-energized sodium pump